MTIVTRARVGVVALVLGAACHKAPTPSTEDIIGEWVKPGQKLPPVSLLISAEGPGLRARLRLSGTERDASVKVTRTTLKLKFDNPKSAMEGQFVSKSELDLRFQPSGEVFRLKKRP